MDISVIGTGYVGLVVGSCLSEAGNHVTCADIDEEKIRALRDGEIPIYEPGLERLIPENREAGRLRFTADPARAVEGAEVIYIAVGTPPDEDGSADLSHVLDVARTIGDNLTPDAIVVTKSTVPVGTAPKVRAEIESLTDVPFHVVSNPEFLKEGAAVEDFMKPDRIVLGVESDRVKPRLEELYEPFVRTGNPIIFMDVASAEMTKYAANAMLATRISFMNQVAELCEETGADVSKVRQGIGSDPRIGSSFLFAGTGYGGSCFPKDVQALVRKGDEEGVDLSILRATHEQNERQKGVLLRKVGDRYGPDLTGRRFGVWGMAFKPGTDDMREAPAKVVVRGLLEAGAEVAVHDPEAMETARAVFGDSVEYADDPYAAARGADGLLICTEWLPYRRPDWEQLGAALAEPALFDGRNLFEPDRMRERGFEYFPIGRTVVRGPEREEPGPRPERARAERAEESAGGE